MAQLNLTNEDRLALIWCINASPKFPKGPSEGWKREMIEELAEIEVDPDLPQVDTSNES